MAMMVEAAKPHQRPVLPCMSDELLTSLPVVSSRRLAPIRRAATSDIQLKKYLQVA
jgi:hypothetical protein